MNKQQTAKTYGILLLCLAIISMIITVITPFLAAFKVDIGIASESESGMDYVSDIFVDLFEDSDDSSNNTNGNYYDADDYENGFYNDYSSNSNDYDYNYGYNSSYDEDDTERTIEDGFFKFIFQIFVIALLVTPIIFAIKSRSAWVNEHKEVLINHSMIVIRACMILNTVYYAMCIFTINDQSSSDIMDIIFGDSLIQTGTFIPMLLQIALLVGSTVLKGHYNKALAGQVKPISLGFISGATATANNNNTRRSDDGEAHRSESEAIELLTKYKTLLDNNVITQEEFDAKKEKLLGELKQQKAQEDQGSSEGTNTTYQEPSYSSNDRANYSNAQPVEENRPPMKWCKFLTHFMLIASTVINALIGLGYMTGYFYDGYEELVYATYPSLQALDVIYGLGAIGMGILALVARNALVWEKRKGPKLICAMYIINAVSAVLYVLIASAITEEMLMNVTTVISVIGGIVMAIINSIYFKKRAEIFKY